MNVDISNIIKNDGAFIEVECLEEFNNFEYKGEIIKFDSPVRFEGILRNDKGILKLKGNAEAKLAVNCARCYKNIVHSMDFSIDEDIVTRYTVEELKNSEDMYFIKEDYVDLNPIILDNLIIQMPMKFICSPGCRGLCSICGNDLNVKECSCRVSDINPEMAKLKDFFIKEGRNAWPSQKEDGPKHGPIKSVQHGNF